MTERFDVVIVGGAVVGASVAYFLKAELGFAGTVAVIERDPSYARSATTLSAASIRQQFSTPENIRLSQFGLAFLKTLPEDEIAFRERGYLLLATPAGREILDANHAVQRGEGADVAVLDPTVLAERFPWLNVADLSAGALGLSGEGWFDAHGLLGVLRRRARDAGAVFVHGEVTQIERAARRVEAVRLDDGRRIACGTLVNAAGPQAGHVAGLAGVPLPVEPRKRCVFVFRCRDETPGMPLLVDTSGVWVRPEGETYICGISPPEDQDPTATDFVVDDMIYEETIWPALAHRVPAFEAIRQVQSWVGHYDFNAFDHNAILGPHPEVTNLLFANGFSGHGLQQAPGAGRAIAELIVHGRYVSLDLSVFGYERISEGRLVREINVI